MQMKLVTRSLPFKFMFRHYKLATFYFANFFKREGKMFVKIFKKILSSNKKYQDSERRLNKPDKGH